MTKKERATVSPGGVKPLFREILEKWDQGITVRRGEKYVFVNQAYADFCGYGSPKELLSLGSILKTFPEHEHERLLRYRAARDNGEEAPTCYEIHAVRKDGSEWWAENRVQEIVWEGEPAYLSAVNDITARKDAEHALKENEQRFRDFAEAASDWFWETDAEHRLTRVSGESEYHVEYWTEVRAGRTRFEGRIAEDTDDAKWEAHRADLDAHRPFKNFQFPARGADGAIHHVRISGKPNWSADGEFRGYRGMGSDITEFVEASERARSAQERLAAAIDGLSESFILFDAQDRLVISNRTWRGLNLAIADQTQPGALFEDILRAQIRVGLIPEARGQEEKWLGVRLERHRNPKGPFEMAHREGRWLLVNDHRLPDGGVIIIATDISDLKRAEHALTDSEQRFRDYAETASDWFWESDGEHRFTYFSGRYENVGLQADERLGKTRLETTADDNTDQPKWRNHLADLAARKPFRNFQHSGPASDGSIVQVSVSGKPIFDEDDKFRGYRGTGVDITERIRADAALRESEARAEQAHARLVDAIESLHEGFALIDSDDRLVMTNKRFLELYAELAHLYVPGTTFEDINRGVAMSGLVAEARGREDEWIRERIERHKNPGPPFERQLGPDLWMLASERRTSDGGTVSVVTDITELKRTEKTLRESEARAEQARARLRDAIESLNEGFMLLDSDERLVMTNKRYLELYAPLAHLYVPGAKAEDIARGIAESGLVAEARGREDEWVRERLERFRNPGPPFERQLGPDLWMLTSERKTSDGGTVTVVTDITELKKRELEVQALNKDLEQRVATRTEQLSRQLEETEAAETALRASEGRLRSVMDSTIDGIIVIDETGRIESFNPSAEKIFGYALDEVIGRNINMLMPEPDQGRHGGYIRHYMETGKAKIMGVGRQVTGLRKDGSTFPMDIGISEVDLGDRRSFTGIARDITRRKLAEQELADKTALLEATFESISQGFALFDEDDRLVFCNEIYRQFAGPVAEMMKPGVAFADLVRAAHDLGSIDYPGDGRAAKIEARLASHRGPVGNLAIRMSNDRWVLITERRSSDGGIALVQTDITDLKGREGELIQAKEQAEAANRAKSEFLARMSHELRTPLNAVLGFGQILETDPEEPLSPTQATAVEQILNSGRHLLELINEVLDLASVESGQVTLSVEAVDPGTIIESCLTLVGPMADDRSIALVNSAAGAELARVSADETRFRQALLNLVSNAVKYNRDGGAVTVEAEETDDGLLRLSVADTGPGIAAEKHDQLFEPFNRLGAKDGKIEGTGIGLTITKQLVELMNGRIGFESSPGKGSIFWIELPLAAVQTSNRGDARRAKFAETAGAPKRLGEEHVVLYVEDDPASVKLMETIVGRLTDLALISTDNAESALQLAGTHRPDIILMDIDLPGMNGIEALEHLRANDKTRDIPVIALSANAMPDQINKAMEAGFLRYLTKPIKVDKLLDAIDVKPRNTAEIESVK